MRTSVKLMLGRYGEGQPVTHGFGPGHALAQPPDLGRSAVSEAIDGIVRRGDDSVQQSDGCRRRLLGPRQLRRVGHAQADSRCVASASPRGRSRLRVSSDITTLTWRMPYPRSDKALQPSSALSRSVRARSSMGFRCSCLGSLPDGMVASQTTAEQPFVAVTVPSLERFADGEAAGHRPMPETTPSAKRGRSVSVSAHSYVCAQPAAANQWSGLAANKP
jgi:hypothetical protein